MSRYLETGLAQAGQSVTLPTTRLSRHLVLRTVLYVGSRYLRADSQYNAATVEQARVENGYDEEVILLIQTR
jgi:hypothetical protein